MPSDLSSSEYVLVVINCDIQCLPIFGRTFGRGIVHLQGFCVLKTGQMYKMRIHVQLHDTSWFGTSAKHGHIFVRFKNNHCCQQYFWYETRLCVDGSRG